jgi:hypothetical protein
MAAISSFGSAPPASNEWSYRQRARAVRRSGEFVANIAGRAAQISSRLARREYCGY